MRWSIVPPVGKSTGTGFSESKAISEISLLGMAHPPAVANPTTIVLHWVVPLNGERRTATPDTSDANAMGSASVLAGSYPSGPVGHTSPLVELAVQHGSSGSQKISSRPSTVQPGNASASKKTKRFTSPSGAERCARIARPVEAQAFRIRTVPVPKAHRPRPTRAPRSRAERRAATAHLASPASRIAGTLSPRSTSPPHSPRTSPTPCGKPTPDRALLATWQTFRGSPRGP